MLQIQSGPRLSALPLLRPLLRPLLKPLRPFAVVACATFIALAAPFAALAQAQVPQARQGGDVRADPLNSEASVPPLAHESAFTQYRRLTDVPVGSWRDANDTVNRIGGWRVYAREAAQPGLPAASPAASPTASTPAGSASAPGMTSAEPVKAVSMPLPGGKDPHGGHKMN